MAKFTDIEKKAIVLEISAVDSMMTIDDAAKKYGCSSSTLRKYIASLKETNPSLYEIYREHALKMENFGKRKGGQNGKRLPTKSIQEISCLASKFLDEEHSLRSFQRCSNIPKSTLHEWFSCSGLDPKTREEILALYSDNRTVNKKTTGRKK